MNQVATTAIVLARINYGEADKIITVITPDQGKLRLMARGVRKIKSKLAGGIELFSVSSVTYIPGKKDISTLVSTRLQTHFGHIVESIDRTMVAYDILKLLNQSTEDDSSIEFYELLLHSLSYLDDRQVDIVLARCWFMMQLLRINGYSPNLELTAEGKQLQVDTRYDFDFQDMSFYEKPNGKYTANHIKMLRLLHSEEPQKLQIIQGVDKVLGDIDQFIRQIMSRYS